MQAFRKGDALSEDAKVDVFESAQAHVGNGQYSYYEEGGRGFLICNSPYLGQGMGRYSYEVFTYSNIWEKEVVAYTMELKGWLDKASIIMDTSVFGQVLFTAYYEDDVLKPDAFFIWLLDEREEPPTLIYLEEISSEEALREALNSIYEAVLYGQSGFLVDIDGEAGLALQNELGWEITQLAYYGTYRMGGHTLDVYRYDYYCKSDRDIHRRFAFGLCKKIRIVGELRCLISV